jgi:hypothetical protein
MGISISYGITVCDEYEETKRLISFLLKHKRVEDNICVLLDKPKCPPNLLDFLYICSSNNNIILKESTFQGHFADWKNELTKMCDGDYIFQIDADEIPNPYLISCLHTILLMNDFDVCLVPRINTVEGLTEEHIKRWGWNINENNWINHPDKQWRLYKNSPEIQWINKVHEKLIGFKTITSFPEIEEFSLYHPKTIEKQEKQNNFYDTL